jgi:hypothetical protein
MAFGALLILFVIGHFRFPVPASYFVWAGAIGFIAAVYVSLTRRSIYFLLGTAIVGIGHEWTREWFYPQEQYSGRFFKANGIWLSVQWWVACIIAFASFFLLFYWLRRQKRE